MWGIVALRIGPGVECASAGKGSPIGDLFHLFFSLISCAKYALFKQYTTVLRICQGFV
jgi:hypothetical protein